MAGIHSSHPKRKDEFSATEAEIIIMRLKGLEVHEISHKLGISSNLVREKTKKAMGALKTLEDWREFLIHARLVSETRVDFTERSEEITDEHFGSSRTSQLERYKMILGYIREERNRLEDFAEITYYRGAAGDTLLLKDLDSMLQRGYMKENTEAERLTFSLAGEGLSVLRTEDIAVIPPRRTFVRRGRLEIIYEILSVSRKPTRKVRILYSCNLSYDQLQKYLRHLIHHGLLSSINKGKERFQTTEKGMELVKGYERLNSLLMEDQNSVIARRRHNSVYRD